MKLLFIISLFTVSIYAVTKNYTINIEYDGNKAVYHFKGIKFYSFEWVMVYLKKYHYDSTHKKVPATQLPIDKKSQTTITPKQKTQKTIKPISSTKKSPTKKITKKTTIKGSVTKHPNTTRRPSTKGPLTSKKPQTKSPITSKKPQTKNPITTKKPLTTSPITTPSEITKNPSEKRPFVPDHKDSAFFRTIKEHIFNETNYYRRRHHVGPVSWNTTIADKAQAYANHLAKVDNGLVHDSDHTYGENLLYCMKQSLKRTVKWWYEEIEDYNFKTHTSNGVTGHFTQLIWKETNEMGCGVSHGKEVSYVVCKYYPPGNMYGEYEKNVFNF
uniref:SCP domain-containing protein n=1 Tax=Parastrongyloides trichosuri TaxID=131310 RepID=A0A0N5A344_PARTI